MAGTREPDEADPRIPGDRSVAHRVADEQDVVGSDADRGRPCTELRHLGMVRPPAVDRSCLLGQPEAPAKLLDELSARAAADEGRDVGVPEALDGRSRVRKRSDASHEAFLGGFETDGDLVEARAAVRDDVELGPEVVARGCEVALRGFVARHAELAPEQLGRELRERPHGVCHRAVEVERHGTHPHVVGTRSASPPRRPQPHAHDPRAEDGHDGDRGQQRAGMDCCAQGAERQD